MSTKEKYLSIANINIIQRVLKKILFSLSDVDYQHFMAIILTLTLYTYIT
jgi:hypothetical protein